MSAFLRAIPTMHVASELNRLRHTGSQKQWQSNDLGDLGALPAAIVYCDIVVTERMWAAGIRRAGLDAMNDTVVLSDLADLPLHLV